MQANDIMTTHVLTVGPEAGVDEIARLLLQRRISAVPDHLGQVAPWLWGA